MNKTRVKITLFIVASLTLMLIKSNENVYDEGVWYPEKIIIGAPLIAFLDLMGIVAFAYLVVLPFYYRVSTRQMGVGMLEQAGTMLVAFLILQYDVPNTPIYEMEWQGYTLSLRLLIHTFLLGLGILGMYLFLRRRWPLM